MKRILLFITLLTFSISGVKAQQNSMSNSGIEQSSVSIFPNPASSQVTVKLAQPSKVSYIAVYSIIGNEVLNKKVDQSSTFKLNVQNLRKGKYIVRIFNVDGSTESMSLIKN
ncbi:T9SS type A sorting domain-containing protein [Faecalibacter bovis]|uniref:T9SS type A sorting domain-containing protein n=1 Tax=Faecalibacter bovis TaxID=2898187 RepID=A0ABX7XDI9_9FLAO|nr:T9SS type A sorting domain-containing protein [Faecalibacter bovis]MBS7333024.1 T9SS type A sorting domain-containing protein [Weeksellaceae bacterium]QTV05984.1 T9SS type A sorting domain-containing protein [Faecalibacter bovis]